MLIGKIFHYMNEGIVILVKNINAYRNYMFLIVA